MTTFSRAAAVLAATTLLAGCATTDQGPPARTSGAAPPPQATPSAGGSEREAFTSRTGDQIAERATEAMNALRSVRIRGTVTLGSDRTALDLTLSKAGDCRGTVSASGQGHTEILGVDGDWWIRPDTEAWLLQQPEDGQELADYVGDRWIVAPDEEWFTETCDLDILLRRTMGFGRGLSSDGGTFYRNDGTDRVVGEQVVVLKPVERVGEEEPPIAYVQQGGAHRIVRLTDDRGEDRGEITFDRFDRPVGATRPAAQDVVELDFGAGTTI